MFRLPRVRGPITLLAAGTILLAACSSGSTGSSSPPPSESGTDVAVSLTEFTIDMPSSVPAGHLVFNVANDGTVVHGFEIEGNGVEKKISQISPGQSDSLAVDLQPGTYDVYCPVDGHRDRGMELELEVAGS